LIELVDFLGGESALHAVKGCSESPAIGFVVLQERPFPEQVSCVFQLNNQLYEFKT